MIQIQQVFQIRDGEMIFTHGDKEHHACVYDDASKLTPSTIERQRKKDASLWHSRVKVIATCFVMLIYMHVCMFCVFILEFQSQSLIAISISITCCINSQLDCVAVCMGTGHWQAGCRHTSSTSHAQLVLHIPER
jgi:hypothetical protein